MMATRGCPERPSTGGGTGGAGCCALATAQAKTISRPRPVLSVFPAISIDSLSQIMFGGSFRLYSSYKHTASSVNVRLQEHRHCLLGRWLDYTESATDPKQILSEVDLSNA